MQINKVLIVLFMIIVFVNASAYAEGLYSNPESIIFDSLNQRYITANPGNNTLVATDLEGNQSLMANGLSVPLGLLIVDQYLLNAGNGNLYIFDLTTDQLVTSVPNPGSPVLMNGLAADTSGFIYVSDYTYQKIFQFEIASQTFTNTFDFGLGTPNGLCFDKANNRLLIVEEGLGDIVAVNLSTFESSTVYDSPLTICDGLTQDNDGHYYISSWGSNSIYKIDSTFTQPVELIFSGFSGPADISYDKGLDILAVPNYNSNTISLFEMKYKAECDTSYGSLPLNVNFTGSCEYEVASWLWMFGDGSTSSEQSPSYIYTTPGMFDVTMQIITTNNDTLYRTIENISALADTLKSDTAYGEANQQVEVVVYGNNTIPVNSIKIPVEYTGNLLLRYDSLSAVGCRTEQFEVISYTHFDTFNKRITCLLKNANTIGAPSLPPGDGAILKLYFTLHNTASPGKFNNVIFDGYSTTYEDYLPMFSGNSFDYIPDVISTVVTVPEPLCCVGDRGNVNMDELDQFDISDVVFMVDYMFNEGTEPTCPEETDLVTDGSIDISDLVFMVDYMFNEGDAPPTC